MPLMSRFRKEKGNDDDEIDALLGDDENAGMFMTTGPQREAPVDEAGAALAVEDGAEPDAPAVVQVTDASSPAAAPAEEAAAPAAEEAVPDDDPLALFRSMQVVTETGGLTEDLEDVSAEELLTELRELQSMLPPVVASEAE